LYANYPYLLPLFIVTIVYPILVASFIVSIVYSILIAIYFPFCLPHTCCFCLLSLLFTPYLLLSTFTIVYPILVAIIYCHNCLPHTCCYYLVFLLFISCFLFIFTINYLLLLLRTIIIIYQYSLAMDPLA